MLTKLLDWFGAGSPAETAASRPSSRWAVLLLAGVLLYTLSSDLWRTNYKLFWYDEVTTIVAASAPSGPWSALKAGVDSSAPGYSYLESWIGPLFADDQVSYRVPSMLGSVFISIFLFSAVRTQMGALAALIAAVFPLITSLHITYAIEARGYELMTCMAMVAWWAWLQADRPGRPVFMGLALAAGISMHYYMVLAFLPLAAGEAARWIRTRQLRLGVWLAMALGGVPMIFYWPLLAGLKEKYGESFWARPSLTHIPAQFDTLVELGDGIGSGLAVMTGAALLLLLALSLRRRSADHLLQPEHYVTSLAFLCLPVASYVLAKVTHGGATPRYAMPMLLGMAVGLAQIGYWLGKRTVALALLLILGVFSMREARNLVQTAQLTPPKSGLSPGMLQAAAAQDLPLVIGSAMEYLSLAYYSRGHSPFLILIDPDAAFRYVGNDTLDLNLLYLQDFLPTAHIEKYTSFSKQHSRFLLFSQYDDPWNWWPQRLRDDGRSLQPLLVEQNHTLYLVN